MDRTALNRWQWAQLALVAMIALVAGLGFDASFAGDQIRRVAVTAAIVPVSLTLVMRILGVRSSAVAAVVSLAGFTLAAATVVFPTTRLALLPGPESLRAIVDGVVNGWDRLVSTALPAPAEPELLIVAFTVIWATAAVTAEVALRVRAPLAPALPLLAGLTATEVLSGGTAFTGRWPVVVQLGLLSTLVLVRTRSARRIAPVGGGVGRRGEASAADGDAAPHDLPLASRSRRLVLAAPVLAVLLVVVPLAAEHLPGADAEPYDPRAERVPALQDRSLVSPLATVVAQIRQSPPTPLFRVESDEAHNWRLVALDRFDGATWASSGQFVLAGSELPQSESTARSRPLRQAFTIDGLAGPWLPAADRPVRTSLDSVAIDAATVSLAHPEGSALLPERYLVDSAVPDHRAIDLAAATVASGDDPRTGDVTSALELPDGMPAEVAGLADGLVAGTSSDFERLRALQVHLRDSGGFVASPEALPGHSYAHVRSFLVPSDDGEEGEEQTDRESGAGDGPSADDPAVGSPEQFATAFAVMARYLGYPTRLAVGYRPGTPTSSGFAVTTADAHVWPEVALEGLGWVPFDPTPAEATDATADEGLEDAQSAAEQVPPPDPEAEEEDEDAVAAGDEEEAGRGGSTFWVRLAGAALVVLIALTVAAGLAVPAVKRRRRRHRRRGPTRQRVLGAWAEAVDRLVDAGVPVRAHMTADDVAAAAATTGLPATMSSIGDLGRLANRARFSPRTVPDALADRAWADAAAVSEALRQAPRRTRVRRALRLDSLRRPS